MRKGRYILLTGLFLTVGFAVWSGYQSNGRPARASLGGGVDGDPLPPAQGERVVRTDEQWRALLTPMQYYVTRQKGTERAFSGKYWNTKAPGLYRCVCCDATLFSSRAKYKSGTGWPSFYEPYREEHVATAEDHGWFATRIEVLCRRCNAHLGHVFEDGPPPTGLRYCINSAALKFQSTPPRPAADVGEGAGQSSPRSP